MKSYKFTIGGEQFKTRIMEYSESKIVLTVNDDEYEVMVEHEESKIAPKLTRVTTQAPTVTKSVAAPAASNSGNDVPAPLPGVVLGINVKVGDTVKVDDTLLILEAMKMENNIESPRTGKVGEILVEEGDSVEKGSIIMSIIPGVADE